MSLTELPLQWPRFCYSDQKATLPRPIPRKRKLCADAASTVESVAKMSKVETAGAPLESGLFFSNIMKKMAEKYKDQEEKSSSRSDDFSTHHRFSSLFPPHHHQQQHPFLFPFLHHQQDLLQQSNPLDLSAVTSARSTCASSRLSEASSSPPRSSESSTSSYAHVIDDWSVDSVCEFVATVESCEEYVQTFRDHCIDGSSLAILSEAHLTGILGMKLGPAIRLIKAIQQLIANE